MGQVMRMEETKAYNATVKKCEGKRPLGRPTLQGSIILNWNSGKQGGK